MLGKKKTTTTTIYKCRKKFNDSFSFLNKCQNYVNSENAKHKTLSFESLVFYCVNELFFSPYFQ